MDKWGNQKILPIYWEKWIDLGKKVKEIKAKNLQQNGQIYRNSKQSAMQKPSPKIAKKIPQRDNHRWQTAKLSQNELIVK
jgi:hypothetical protein